LRKSKQVLIITLLQVGMDAVCASGTAELEVAQRRTFKRVGEQPGVQRRKRHGGRFTRNPASLQGDCVRKAVRRKEPLDRRIDALRLNGAGSFGGAVSVGTLMLSASCEEWR
jgi:hypothetical protein